MVNIIAAEVFKAIGRFLINPLLIWFLILLIMTSYFRIKRERNAFGIKVFGMFAEYKGTFITALVLGIGISVITIGTGFVLHKEILIAITVAMLVLSLTFNASLLSSSYTFALSYIILLFFPLFKTEFGWDLVTPSRAEYTQILILLGILLIVEAIMIRQLDRNKLFPKLKLSERGVFIGGLEAKKLTVIPIFLLTPTGALGGIGDYWPYFFVGNEQFSLVLFPFILGFNHTIWGSFMYESLERISSHILALAMLIIAIAIASLYMPFLSLVGIIVGLLGREFITYYHRLKDKESPAYYSPIDEGLKVIGLMPNEAGERLGLLVGETISEVNGVLVNNPEDFYQALHTGTGSFRLNIIDDKGESRVITSSIYDTDHHALGIVFPDKPRY